MADPGSKDSRLRISVIATWMEGRQGQTKERVLTIAGQPMPDGARILDRNEISVQSAADASNADDVNDLVLRHPNVTFVRIAWFNATPTRSFGTASSSVTLSIANPKDGSTHAMIRMRNILNSEQRHILVPLSDDATGMTTVTIIGFPSGITDIRMITARMSMPDFSVSGAGPEHVLLVDVVKGQVAFFVINRCGAKPCANMYDVQRY